MKTFIGVLCMIVAFLSMLVGGPALVAYCIYEIVQLIQQDSVTFLDIFWLVAVYILRAFIVAVGVLPLFFVAFICLDE